MSSRGASAAGETAAPPVATVHDAPAIIALLGPTGVGKTAAAVALCQQLNGEIVGADSVQVYRGFDLGSNKPTPAELRGVAHHLIDVLEPTEHIDAASFAVRADAAIAELSARGKVPVVVGGTGLWLRALLRGLVQLPAVDAELRRGLEQDFQTLGADVLHARLRELDPLTAARVHQSDMVRVVRALEVHAQTGHPLGELRAAHALGAPRYRAHTVVLDLPLPEWRELLAARTARMLAAGFVEEVRGLVARHGPALRALRAVGYRQVAEGLAAGHDEVEMARRVLSATAIYGRRQRNWFRTEPGITARLSPSALLYPDSVADLQRHLQRDGRA